MLHEVESSALYAERTQTIVTQTAPGRDVAWNASTTPVYLLQLALLYGDRRAIQR